MAYLMEDDGDTIHAATYGFMSRSDLEFFNDRVESGLKYARGMAAKYLKSAKDQLSNFDYDRMRERVAAVKDRFTRRWDEDRVRAVLTLPDLQQAKSVMRSWLMANPRAKTLWRQDKISGYGGDFYDPEPWVDDPTDNRLYRIVMNGAYVGDDDEDRYVTYVDALHPDENEDLTDSERDTIQLAWQLEDQLFDAGGQDPTSVDRHLL